MPGTATGVHFNLPLAVSLFQAKLRSRLVPSASFWLQTIFYAALSGAITFGVITVLHAILGDFPIKTESLASLSQLLRAVDLQTLPSLRPLDQQHLAIVEPILDHAGILRFEHNSGRRLDCILLSEFDVEGGCCVWQ
jgi:hypothetical protein